MSANRLDQLFIPKVEFDWEYYIEQSVDLAKAGVNNLETAYRHWISYGCYENRPVRSFRSGLSHKVQLKPGEKFLAQLGRTLPKQVKPLAQNQPKPIKLDYKVAILLHIYNIDLFPFFVKNLNYLNENYCKENFDIYINIVEDNPYTGDLRSAVSEYISTIQNPSISFFFNENRGGDIGGFMLLSKYIIGLEIDYKYIIFAHSKAKANWRKELCQTIFNIKFESLPDCKDLGLIGSKEWIHTFDRFKHPDEYRRFKYHLDTLCQNYEVNCDQPWQFVAGTMFLANISIIKYIADHNIDSMYFKLNKPESVDANWLNLMIEEFKKDTRGVGNDLQYRIRYGKSLHPDYMIEHGVERIIGLISHHLNLKVYGQ